MEEKNVEGPELAWRIQWKTSLAWLEAVDGPLPIQGLM